jgi:hypothetical protein
VDLDLDLDLNLAFAKPQETMVLYQLSTYLMCAPPDPFEMSQSIIQYIIFPS